MIRSYQVFLFFLLNKKTVEYVKVSSFLFDSIHFMDHRCIVSRHGIFECSMAI